jgi:hypothetical protein
MDEMLHFLDYVLVVKSVDVGLDDAFFWEAQFRFFLQPHMAIAEYI